MSRDLGVSMGANTWVSILAIQALRMYRERLEPGKAIDLEEVVCEVFEAHRLSPEGQTARLLYDDVLAETQRLEHEQRWQAVDHPVRNPRPWSDTDKD